DHYVEVVAAPEYEHGVVGIFENTEIKDKKVNPRLRVVEVPNIDKLPRYIEDGYDRLEMIQLDDGSFFLQEPYLTKIKSPDDVEKVTERHPNESEWEDLLFNWYVCQGTRSNAVTIGKLGEMLAVGTGRQDRVGAIEDAIRKA
ncbi:MAG: IMP cyclohydrolase, partial [Candidatus Aenigmarchaeota archaeon]|nr:IMP cyclohydrolase [Candidatus Aenigmarchaeota archaeon]